MNYYPKIGGQENFLRALKIVVEKNGWEFEVLQPVRSSSKQERGEEVNFPANVRFFSNIPYSYLIDRNFAKFSWFRFNFEAKRTKAFFEDKDLIISSYPFHYPAIEGNHSNVIVISHGVLWEVPPKSFFDKYHKRIAKRVIDENITIVANDTDFYREMGLDVPPKVNAFKNVGGQNWFLPNCVDPELFFAKEDQQKEKIILVPRNIREDRGIHLAIEAFETFLKKNGDFKMLVVGTPNSGPYFERCLALADQLQIKDKIEYYGHAEWSKMIDFYNKSMVTLIPTTGKEGTSRSALEAMACKSICVSTNVGGLSDLPSLLCEPNAKSVAEALQTALDKREELVDQQFQEVMENYRINLWESAWTEILQSKLV